MSHVTADRRGAFGVAAAAFFKRGEIKMKMIGVGARAQFRSTASIAKASASAFAILAATPFAAYAADAPQTAQAPVVEEVVVTGSRIVQIGRAHV